MASSASLHTSRATRLLMSGAALAIAACTKGTAPVAIAGIQLQPGFDSIEVGQTFSNWLVTAVDAKGNVITGRSYDWESQNTAVATIDGNGVVTGVASGQSLITVRADGKSAQATIKVLSPILSIVATPDSFDLPLTTTRTIAVQLVGPGGQALTGRTITWASSNPSVAAVSATGVATPISIGTATITIYAGSKQAQVRVRVVAEPVATVRITPQQSVQVIRLGQSVQLGAECLNAAMQPLTGRTVLWNSSSPVVASVSSAGLVTGASLGQATITATCDHVSASILAQVTPIRVSSVAITPPQLSLYVGQQGQLSATARDSANNVLSLQGRSVLWTSDNLPVATVSGQGVVGGVSKGLAHVQVTVDDVVSPSIDVNVDLVPVASVTVGPVNGSVKAGQQIQMSATVRDAQGNVLNGRQVVWTSLDTNIATIGSDGIALGVKAGQVTIKATCEGVSGQVLLNVTP